MESKDPPIPTSEYNREIRLESPDLIIDALKGSPNLGIYKLGKDIERVVRFIYGEASYVSPDLNSARALKDISEQYSEDKNVAKEPIDKEVLALIQEARTKLGRASVAAATHFVEIINEIITQNPGLFHLVYTDGTRAQLEGVWGYVDEHSGEAEFYDNADGAADARRVETCMVDIMMLPAGARREFQDRF